MLARFHDSSSLSALFHHDCSLSFCSGLSDESRSSPSPLDDDDDEACDDCDEKREDVVWPGRMAPSSLSPNLRSESLTKYSLKLYDWKERAVWR